MEPFDAESFIFEVQRRPAIWDVDSREYSDWKARKNAWKEIVDIFIKKEKASDSQKRVYGRQLERRWKNFRSSYIREIKLRKETKEGSERMRPVYKYFKNLSFLGDIVPKQSSKSMTETSDLSDNRLQHREEHDINENDCDRLFLLSLLNPLKQIPEHARLGVKRKLMEVIDSELQLSRQILSQTNSSQYGLGQSSTSHSGARMYSQFPDVNQPSTSYNPEIHYISTDQPILKCEIVSSSPSSNNSV